MNESSSAAPQEQAQTGTEPATAPAAATESPIEIRHLRKALKDAETKLSALQSERQKEEDGRLSEVERLRKQVEAAKHAEEKIGAYSSFVEGERDVLLSSLPEAARTSLSGALEGLDPLRQLQLIKAASAVAQQNKQPEPARSAPVVRGGPASPGVVTREALARNPELLKSLSKEEQRQLLDELGATLIRR